jgi:hypothetical protein
LIALIGVQEADHFHTLPRFTLTDSIRGTMRPGGQHECYAKDVVLLDIMWPEGNNGEDKAKAKAKAKAKVRWYNIWVHVCLNHKP